MARDIGTIDATERADQIRMFVLRVGVVAAEAATLIITYRLWQARSYYPNFTVTSPPLLPALPLPQLDMLPWLLASLVVVLYAPRWGVPLHWGLMILAMLMDQFRIQPQIVSLMLLLIATLPGRWPPLIGRTHLIVTWAYAGFHKLVSSGFYDETIPFLFRPLVGDVHPGEYRNLFIVVGALAALGEISLAGLALWPRTRKVGVILACGMHVTLLVWLSLVMEFNGGVGWNAAVWPWNAALALAAITLLWPWKGSLWADWRSAGRWPKAAVLVMLLSPIGYYFGVLDGFLAHCVYANNTPIAKIILPNGQGIWVSGVAFDLNAGMPPAHRLYEAYFRQVGQPGEKMVIDDPRWCAQRLGYAHRELHMLDGREIRETDSGATQSD